MLALFTAGTFCSAFLLFIVQPLFARLILPLLGGAPAVWTACMLFFQAALLAGYAYAHATIGALGVRRQIWLHAPLVLLPVAVLPFDVSPAMAPGREAAPVVWLLGVMLASIGLPFFVLAATAPLLQRWLAATDHPSASDPYFLYAASNAGSLTALLMYPVVVEPLFTLRTQRLAWAAGFALTALLVAACAVATRRMHPGRETSNAPAEPPIRWSLRLRWLALAFVPSGLLLAVTAHISTDLAAIPLLWIVPLALYLLTFIVAFGVRREGAERIARRLLPLVLLPLVMFLVVRGGAALWFLLPLHLVAFATIALVCHAELAALRPRATALTSFYLWMAGGGALGGLLNTAAPVVFTGVAEYPLLLAAACVALVRPGDVRAVASRPQTHVKPAAVGLTAVLVLLAARTLDLTAAEALPFLGFPALIAFSASRQSVPFALCVGALLGAGAVAPIEAWGTVLHQQRTFFGVYRVTRDTRQDVVSLYHGTTLHGSQRAGEIEAEPLSYYHRDSPVADVLALRPQEYPASVGVVGLGVGSLAAYARPGERWTFYEIDPAVDDIARDARFFTFLDACGARCRTVIGDGRLTVAESAERHDVLVLDAFSSDAIPVHLLTREAVVTYLSRLSDDGMLAFHVSNRHFDLRPVLGGLAAALQLVAFGRDDQVDVETAAGRSSSRWVAIGRRGSRMEVLAGQAGWRRVTTRTSRVWTDDFSNIWAVLRR